MSEHPTLEEIIELGRKATAAGGGDHDFDAADFGGHFDIEPWKDDWAAYVAAAANVADKLAAKLLAVRGILGPRLKDAILNADAISRDPIMAECTLLIAEARELLKLLSEESGA